ncbi:formate dehydrogenase accessory sulfurtransferase FdhD [Halomonas halocynthiae]|uniref:formate dehydrogenase accessory sulfurtransferase FdhD n=1 Tax=Halomonas halocynthiae TaxID=176290 RepID=UPI0004128154|nr:formate dehydrogenase accessory sulfurtransferase FdhD [Halomonas halocynthiae]
MTKRDGTVPQWVHTCQLGHLEKCHDLLADEVPVALVYNGVSHAVMMASPVDLDDFALGFSLSEGILTDASELYDWSLQETAAGWVVELAIASSRMAALKKRRRNLTGRTGCGLCGTESLDQAIRPVAHVQAPQLSHSAVEHAITTLEAHQPLQAITGASHGAAWCSLEGEIMLVREDIGRHNALDKLIGALAKESLSGEGPKHTLNRRLSQGFVLVSSRASYEMVHKSASVGIGALVSVSAATGLAVDQARKAGLLLIGFARPKRHVIYHRPAIRSVANG